MNYKDWMVHRFGPAISKMHSMSVEAKKEAARLAKENIGVSFNVLEAMIRSAVSLPPAYVEKLYAAPVPPKAMPE